MFPETEARQYDVIFQHSLDRNVSQSFVFAYTGTKDERRVPIENVKLCHSHEVTLTRLFRHFFDCDFCKAGCMHPDPETENKIKTFWERCRGQSGYTKMRKMKIKMYQHCMKLDEIKGMSIRSHHSLTHSNQSQVWWSRCTKWI